MGASMAYLTLGPLKAEIRYHCEELEHSGPVRELMRAGRWLVPESERPKVAAPPPEGLVPFGIIVRRGTTGLLEHAARKRGHGKGESRQG